MKLNIINFQPNIYDSSFLSKLSVRIDVRQHCLLLSQYVSLVFSLLYHSSNETAFFTWIPNPASGLMFGSERRSVDLTKKFPWKVCRARPRVQRTRITASNPIFRVK